MRSDLTIYTILAVGLMLAAWRLAARFRRTRRPRRWVHEQGYADDALRVEAEALLAARRARGELDQPTYEQLVQRLWGLPAPAGAPPDRTGPPPSPPGNLPDA